MDFRKCVTLEISKNSLYKVIFSTLFGILCIAINFYAKNLQLSQKRRIFLLNYLNLKTIGRLRRQKCVILAIFLIIRSQKNVSFKKDAPLWGACLPKFDWRNRYYGNVINQKLKIKASFIVIKFQPFPTYSIAYREFHYKIYNLCLQT